MDYVRELGSNGDLWFALPRKVDAWWRGRHQMRVEKKKQSWQITGNDSERFTLVLAADAAGKLAYEFENSACRGAPFKRPLEIR
jgi:hypothetical protein